MLWVWGVLIGIVGCVLTALGLVLQKYSHTNSMRHSIAGDQHSLEYYRQPMWQAGFFVFGIGQVLNVLSLAMAPQVMLSCLGAVSLISNAVFARVVLGESLVQLQMLAMGAMVLAGLMVIFTTPTPDAPAISGELGEMMRAFVKFDFLALVLVLIICFTVFWMGTAVFPQYRFLFWTVFAAAISGFSMATCKCVSLLLAYEPPSGMPTPWWSIETYCIIVVTVVLCAMLIHCLNTGLSHGDALIVVPTYYSLGMLSQILVAGVLFKELTGWRGMGQIAVFVSGVVLLVGAVVTMTCAQIMGEADEIELLLESIPDDSKTMGEVDSARDVEPALAVPSPKLSSRTSLLAAILSPTDEDRSSKTYRTETSITARSTTTARRVSRVTTLDADFFNRSFPNGRTYTVSVVGLGIA